jgi:hypothetical protein
MFWLLLLLLPSRGRLLLQQQMMSWNRSGKQQCRWVGGWVGGFAMQRLPLPGPAASVV